jgi:hypothetical protein
MIHPGLQACSSRRQPGTVAELARGAHAFDQTVPPLMTAVAAGELTSVIPLGIPRPATGSRAIQDLTLSSS